MPHLTAPSLPSLPTQVLALMSRPTHWGAWANNSVLSRIWRQDVLHGDLVPLRAQLDALSAALEAVVCTRREAQARDEVHEAVQKLVMAVQDHQHFLTTLSADWYCLHELTADRHLLKFFDTSLRGWQQSLLQSDALEAERFAHCERLGWKLLGHAALMTDIFMLSSSVDEDADDLGQHSAQASSLVQQLMQRWRRWRGEPQRNTD